MSTLAERLHAALPAAHDGIEAMARQRFLDLGLPRPKTEAWRYSPMRALEKLELVEDFLTANDGAPDLPGVATLARFAGGGVEQGEIPAGIELGGGLDFDIEAGSPPALDPVATDPADAFLWLNLAGAHATLNLDVRERVAGIHRLVVHHDALGLAQYRLRLRVHAGAALSLLLHHEGPQSASGLVNLLSVIDVEEGGELTLIRVQEAGSGAHLVERTEATVSGGGRLALVALELGALWSRHDLLLTLEGAGAGLELHGLVALGERQHHDTRLEIRHAAGQAKSESVWKGIAGGRARGVFGGRIEVAPGADGTDARLRTANLLLSPHAEIDARPELVIEADEVQCAHGATVGQIDERALFYLRSRGIPADEARRLLTLAFGGEVLSRVGDEPLREALAARVAVQLPQG
jgi:Fe-S cluster assembly protein SufD